MRKNDHLRLPLFHFDADPDADSDPAFHFDADPEPNQLFTLMWIPIQLPKNMRIRIHNTGLKYVDYGNFCFSNHKGNL
jgi:hypothetical protein